MKNIGKSIISPSYTSYTHTHTFLPFLWVCVCGSLDISEIYNYLMKCLVNSKLRVQSFNESSSCLKEKKKKERTKLLKHQMIRRCGTWCCEHNLKNWEKIELGKFKDPRVNTINFPSNISPASQISGWGNLNFTFYPWSIRCTQGGIYKMLFREICYSGGTKSPNPACSM